MKEFFQKIATLLKENKKYQIALIVVVAVLAAGSVWGYYLATGGDFSVSEIIKPDKEVDDVTARKLDGVIVETKEETNPYPVAVMVENLSSIRPQSGISRASVVYEALAEGGISRFMLVFPGDKNVAESIGPVRSARSYYLEWLSEYDALYAFSGAYPPVLAAISGLEIKNMNAMYDGSKYYWRDHSFAAPHNMFTSSENLGYAIRDKGLDGVDEAKFRAWKFKDEAELEDRPTDAKNITIDFSAAAYSVEYKYDRESNTYLRFNAGAEHTDRNTSEQLAPKNVVVYKLSTRVIDDKGRLEMDVVGEGEATMFSNGMATKGTWKKASRTDRTLFYDESGKEYEFSRGQTWVDVIPDDKSYEYN